MRRVVSFPFALLAVTTALAACATHNGAVEQAAAPAAPLVAPLALPHPTIASLTKDPAAPSADNAAAAAPSACPDGMVLVDGDYCSDVREECIEWIDPPNAAFRRCAKFSASTCVGERVHKRFCIDRDEQTAQAPDALPISDVSWEQAKQVCEQQSRRLCKETEWELACEGEQMLPYPTGYERDARDCNYDKDDLVDTRTGKLRDKRMSSSALAACTSPFGARNMTGNVDEWVWRDRTWGEWRSALKGGWWMPARNRCRPATTAHDEHYHQLQTGVRCCADARDY